MTIYLDKKLNYWASTGNLSTKGKYGSMLDIGTPKAIDFADLKVITKC